MIEWPKDLTPDEARELLKAHNAFEDACRVHNAHKRPGEEKKSRSNDWVVRGFP